MESPQLVRLERIARNLPIVGKMTMVMADSVFGTVYMACGKDGSDWWRCVWGLRNYAQLMNFPPGTGEKDVLQQLFDDAHAMAQEMDKRSMFDEGRWSGDRKH